jgi:hypothetical protein
VQAKEISPALWMESPVFLPLKSLEKVIPYIAQVRSILRRGNKWLLYFYTIFFIELSFQYIYIYIYIYGSNTY